MKPLSVLRVFFAALLLAGCSSYADALYFGRVQPPAEEILRVGNGAEPRTFDPHGTIAYPDGHVILNVFEGLTSRDGSTLEPRPALALRWINDPSDRRRWLFYLRRGAVFSDGEPITAHTFVWSWRRLVDPGNASPYVFAALGLRNARFISEGKLPPTALGVSALDDYTLAVVTEEPLPYLPRLMSAWAFAALPRQAIERWGSRWARPEHSVASGPFVLAEHRPYDRIVLRKNPRYWDQANVHLDRVYLYPVTEGAQNVNLYRAGEMDVIRGGYLPLSLVPQLTRYRDFQTGAYFAARYYSFNIHKKPFDDLRVRQALSLAIDRFALAQKYLGNGEQPAGGIVPPILPGYRSLPGPAYDLDRARQLLAEAGYPGGRGFPRFAISTTHRDDYRRTAEAVQAMWRALGLDVRIESEEAQTYQARLEARNFDVVMDGWVGDYLDPTAFLDVFVGNNPNNHPGWQDSHYIALLGQAARTAHPAGRLRLLEAAERRLAERLPVIPLTFLALSYLKKPWVEGWYLDPLEQHQFKYVRLNRQWARPKAEP